MAENKIAQLKPRFYQIAESGRYRDTDKAYRIIDAIAAPCSPDHYDETLERAVREQLGKWGLETPAYIEWANDILKAIEANRESDHDLRGMPKNIHHR